MITRQQSILIHTALRDIRRQNPDFDDAAYRTSLRTLCHVESSKDLDQIGFEQILSFFESIGWTDPNHPRGYWKERGDAGASRLLHAIKEFCQQHSLADAYVAGVVGRSAKRRSLDECTAADLGKVFEALKAISRRRPTFASSRPAPSPRPATAAEIQQMAEDELPV